MNFLALFCLLCYCSHVDEGVGAVRHSQTRLFLMSLPDFNDRVGGETAAFSMLFIGVEFFLAKCLSGLFCVLQGCPSLPIFI